MATSVTRDAVAAHMGMSVPPAPDTVDGRHLDASVNAVNAVLPDFAHDLEGLPIGAEWPAHVLLAGIMLGARLYARRNSPTGVATFNDLGAQYVSRWDPDIERLLRIGAWEPPRVGG
ncbi:hypothetical protein [Streptomyces synnematoformans]|uniref:Uncharacterized protein n=1 Tax=Streptomyces synnematoformans TaxID=415721 RepID=A0ABP5JIR8_9ACTN